MGANRPAADIGNWLFDRGSLTQRLIEFSQQRFSVTVLRQSTACPRPSEARALLLPARRKAMVREVLLHGRGEPWVFARSILPLSTLSGRLRALRRLDNRPLGALLFNDPGMRRGAIEVARILPRHQLLPPPLQRQLPVWGRRSVFYLDDKPLLVNEIFLDTFPITSD